MRPRRIALSRRRADPDVELTSSDLVRRDAYDAQLAAWSAAGHPLTNARFVQGNFSEIYSADAAASASIAPNSLVVCVHGCNDASAAAAELARRHAAGWAVLPCCMQTAGYAPSVESLKVRRTTAEPPLKPIHALWRWPGCGAARPLSHAARLCAPQCS